MSNEAEGLRVIEGQGEGVEDPLVGQIIDGRYQVESVLGEGGMGLVYRARHVALGKPLAIKVLRPDVSKDAQMIARFRQEAQSASAIGNEHIIDITDFGTLPDGSTYFVMEFLEGRDLTDLIETAGRLPVERAVHIAKQICMALGAAHEQGIVHRDLKPDNIFLIKRGRDEDFVKVLDFGIAKVGGAASKLTRAGQVFGTPHYMSPEQCAGRGVDHRTDIYALGVILYEMLTGQVPFDADNLMGILTKHLYEEPVPPSQLEPPVQIPAELERVVLKCLVKDADQRYATMDEVLADLEAIVPAGSASVASSAAGYTSSASSPGGALGHTAVALPGAEGGGRKGLVIGLAAVLLLGGAGAAAMLLGGEEPAAGAEAGAAAAAKGAEEKPPTGAKEAPEQAAGAGTMPTSTPKEAPQVESGARDTAKVNLVTEPAGAEVWLGDELLGNTPLSVPRPGKGEKLEIVLKLPGYKDRQVRVSALTSENVRVRLEKAQEEVRRSSRRGHRRRRGERGAAPSKAQGSAQPQPAAQPQQPAAQPQPQPRPPRRPRRPAGSTEIVDPWSQ